MSIPMTDPDGRVHHAATEAEAVELQLVGYQRGTTAQRAYVPAEHDEVAERAYVPPAEQSTQPAEQAPVEQPTPDVSPTGGDVHPADAIGGEQPAEVAEPRRTRRS
ncbi:hypothetical protein GCM10023201_40930 [Actinomycetospora corticicola]|uniref:Uncharacterized protein n=1 Tax=Actinomycetospora corticicola TaxID=663602 RepID=A0A7Y9DWI3_9PSEU|nr:hypothetical protein [Actinomycetospora corticicola]NYD36823.1 hypothetical protein [Actinomycetospora corticicola]